MKLLKYSKSRPSHWI